MSFCRLLRRVFVVRPIGAAMNRRAKSIRRALLRCWFTAGRSIPRLIRAAGLCVVKYWVLCSPSLARSDLVFLCAPRRLIRRGAFLLRLCAPRAVSRLDLLAGSSMPLAWLSRAGGLRLRFYVGPADRLRLRRRRIRFGAGRRRRAVRRSSLLAGCGLRRCCGVAAG